MMMWSNQYDCVEKDVVEADRWFDLYDEQRRYDELYPI